MPSKKKSKTKAGPKAGPKARPRAAKSNLSLKSSKRKPVQKKVASRSKAKARKKAPSVSTQAELNREFQGRRRTATGTASRRRSADFQGLSREEQANSESVDELVEEGNLFEAGAVAGVEAADNADEREVRTHELPEDDVPEEYLDKD